MDRMTSMAVFAEVVATGSFAAAAKRLGLSKSTVSKHVAQLEDRLGAQLLHRTTRRLSLTEVGGIFHARCTQIVREVEDAEREVGDSRAAPHGLLRVNAPQSFGQLCLAPAIGEMLLRHPALRVELQLDDRAVDAIDGGFDLTIRVAAALADSSLVARRLAPLRLVVCAAPAYLARRGVPRVPADLGRHECLLYTNLATPEVWRFAGPGGEERIAVGGRLRSNNGDVLRDAAIAGLGLVQLPRFLVERALAERALEAVLVPHEDRSAAIWALYPPTRHVSPKVRACVDFLAEQFGSGVWMDAGWRQVG